MSAMTTRSSRSMASALLSIACLCFSPAGSGAQPVDLSESQALGVRSVSRFRAMVREGLSPSEIAVERTIEYEVVPTWNTNAFATISRSGQRRIQVFAGDMMLMYWLSHAVGASRWGATEDCVVPYITGMMNAIEANTRQQRTGLGNRVPVSDFFLYARGRPTSCGGFSPEAYARDAIGRENLRAIHGASIRWVLAHELAHHLKGHLEQRRPKGSKAEQLEQSRRNEREADYFALSEITRDDRAGALMAMPAFLLTASFSCTVEEEPGATHPSAAWRWGLMVDSVRAFALQDEEFKRWLDAQGLRERFLSSLEQMGEVFRK